MTPKFSKALLAAGLAAALVGCGGGSSTTTMADSGDSGSMNETTALDGTYATANDLVGKLSADSTPAQFKEARDARTALLNQLLAAGDDVSSEKRADLNSKLTTLENAIMAAEKARNEKAEEAAALAKEKADNEKAEIAAGLLPSAWYKSVKDHTPVAPGPTNWPDNDVLVGTKTPATGIPEGWTGTNYEYEEGATNEQGKTFMKTVTRMTPGITMRWDKVVLEAAKTNRNSVINDFLGGPGLVIEAERVTDATEGTTAGSGTVSATISSHVIVDGTTNNPSPEGTGLALFTNNRDHIRVTDFRRNDFMAMSIGELTANGIAANTIDTSTTPSTNVWLDLDAIKSLGALSGTPNTPSSGIYVRWKGIPGKLTVQSSQSDLSIRLRFNNGRLEYFPVGNIGATNNVIIAFRPFVSDDLDEIDTNIHAMNLMVRPESSKTATTELAYWASTMKDNSKVTLSTFARGMDFAPVTTAPEMLTGSATYNGLAAGYYAVGTESNGEFTADTMLTANFKTEMISGMIKGFEAVTGGADLSEWSLTLNSADFIDNKKADVMDDDVFQTFTGRTVSNGGMLGHWKGEFLGVANPGLEDDLESAVDMTNDYPEAVVGNFTGHFAANDGHVAGAFGVELHEDDKNK